MTATLQDYTATLDVAEAHARAWLDSLAGRAGADHGPTPTSSSRSSAGRCRRRPADPAEVVDRLAARPSRG